MRLKLPHLKLPRFPTAKNLPGLLTIANQMMNASSELVCDGEHLKFIDPCGLAVFGCVTEHLMANNIPVHLENFSDQHLSYISRMDALSDLISRHAELGPRHDRHDALLEVTKVSVGQPTDETARRLTESLIGGMSDLPEDEEPDEMTCMTRRDTLEEPLAYIFTELLDNVFQHGGKHGFDPSAWVCAQYYPKNDLVRFAIVDNGCGFLASLSEHPDLPEQTDADAIQLALKEKVSGNLTLLMRGADHSANQGIGLTIVSRIVQRSGGQMWLASGNASLKPDGHVDSTDGWQGCILTAELPREALMKIRIHQVIQGLSAPATSPKLDFS